MHYSVSIFRLCIYNGPLHKIPSRCFILFLRDWTGKLLTGSSMPLRGHYTLQNDYKMPCVRNYRISMCCSCRGPSTCAGNYWCTCIHVAIPLWIHISEAVLWPFQLVSVYMGKCQSSEQRWMCYLTEWPSDSSLLQKNAHSAVRTCAKINSGIFWPDMTSGNASVPQFQHNNNTTNN